MRLSQKKQAEYLRTYEILMDCEEQTPEQRENYKSRIKHLDRPIEEINAEREEYELWIADKVYENLLNHKIYDEETGQVVISNIDELKEIIKQIKEYA